MDTAEFIKELYNSLSLVDVFFSAGVIIFTIWAFETSLGKKSLEHSPMRRNNMKPFLPFIPLFIWFTILTLGATITRKLLPDLPQWQSTFADNLVYCFCAVITSVLIIYLAKKSFARRLKGFGLKVRTIPKDFLTAILNLLSIWPIMMAVLFITIAVGQIIVGPSFEIEPHEELKVITANQQLPLRILILLTTIIVVPVFEELLFRGLFQTMIRSFLISPWPSIVVSSLIFSMVHSNPKHWPALFVLSMCIGYSYEKSGSLFRPIFVHSLFNATSIIGTLYTQ